MSSIFIIIIHRSWICNKKWKPDPTITILGNNDLVHELRLHNRVWAFSRAIIVHKDTRERNFRGSWIT